MTLFRRLLPCALAVALLACGQGTEAGKAARRSSAPAPAVRPAPPFKLQSLTGETVSSEALKGKPVFLDFWATWCPPCRASMPAVEEFYARFKSKGVQVYGVNVGEDADVVQAFVKERGVAYPVLLDADASASESYRVQGIPGFFLLDQDGRMIRRWDGFHPGFPDEWAEAADALLAH